MKNEAWCKILCHNIRCVIHGIHELGFQPDFSRPERAGVSP